MLRYDLHCESHNSCSAKTNTNDSRTIWLTLFGLLISTGLELVGVVRILTMARRQNYEHICINSHKI